MLIFCDHWLWPLVMLIQSVQQAWLGEGSENEDKSSCSYRFCSLYKQKNASNPKDEIEFNYIEIQVQILIHIIDS